LSIFGEESEDLVAIALDRNDQTEFKKGQERGIKRGVKREIKREREIKRGIKRSEERETGTNRMASEMKPRSKFPTAR